MLVLLHASTLTVHAKLGIHHIDQKVENQDATFDPSTSNITLTITLLSIRSVKSSDVTYQVEPRSLLVPTTTTTSASNS